MLLASPEAAASEWVDRELRHWLSTKPASHILVVLTGGELYSDRVSRALVGSAVPSAIATAFDDEPRHVDLRWARSSTDLDLRNGRFRDVVAQLAAPAHGVGKDESRVRMFGFIVAPGDSHKGQRRCWSCSSCWRLRSAASPGNSDSEPGGEPERPKRRGTRSRAGQHRARQRPRAPGSERASRGPPRYRIAREGRIPATGDRRDEASLLERVEQSTLARQAVPRPLYCDLRDRVHSRRATHRGRNARRRRTGLERQVGQLLAHQPKVNATTWGRGLTFADDGRLLVISLESRNGSHPELGIWQVDTDRHIRTIPLADLDRGWPRALTARLSWSRPMSALLAAAAPAAS